MMMVRTKSQRKGADFERKIADELNKGLIRGSFKRVPGSGALGTIMHESLLTGDVNGEIYGFPLALKAECKAGYSNKKGAEAKSLSLEKRWLDKIREEASTNYKMPIFFGKFDNVHFGVRAFVAFDLDTFIELANHVTKMQQEIDNLYGQLERNKEIIE